MFIHLPQIALLLAFAGAALWTTSGGAARIACQRLLYGAFACIVATALARFIDIAVYNHAPRAWLLLNALGSVLTAAAAPGLWGCAVAREEDLSSTRVGAAARISAKATFAAVVLLVASELIAVAVLGIVQFVKRSGPIGAAASIVMMLGRGCLLWAAWETWRPAADEVALRRHARRIRALMPAAVLGTFGSAVISAFNWSDESHGFGATWASGIPMLIWHGVVQLTLALLTTILVAVALEAPERVHEPKRAPYFPEPPPPPRETGPIDVP